MVYVVQNKPLMTPFDNGYSRTSMKKYIVVIL